MKNDIATTKSVFAKLKGGASLAAFAKLKLKIVDMQAVLIAANPAPCNIHCTFFLFISI